MIPFQHLFISVFNRFENLEKFGSAAYWPTLKIPIFHLFHELGKIGESSLDQHSNIPLFNFCVHRECKYSLTQTFKNIYFQSMDELGKLWEFTQNKAGHILNLT